MIEMAQMAFKMIAFLADQAERMGAANAPEWAKYVTAGAYVMSQAGAAILEQQSSGTDRFDKMTPQEIRDYLTPPTWDEL